MLSREARFETSSLFELKFSLEIFPEIFDRAKQELEREVLQWGFVESREDFWKILKNSHVVVSTAKHEFFGASM